MVQTRDTSWQNVAPWYNQIVGNEGHYYHQHVVLPGVVRLLALKPDSKLLDLGCGQGILARSIPPIAEYLGLDKAVALINTAKQSSHTPHYTFQVRDVTKPAPTARPRFSHAALILALQNMEHPEGAIRTAAAYLVAGGKLVIVLNHPAFRIPRQSGWKVDERTKQQYRWINRYASPLKIPIEMTPGQQTHNVTWSFHRSLQDYVQMLTAAGFVLTGLEEWTSDKESVGKAARMENRARSEFPLFLTLVAERLT